MNLYTYIIMAQVVIILTALIIRVFIKVKPPMSLETGEKRIGELFVKTDRVRLKAMIGTSPFEGKLILTNRRLIFSDFFEKQFVISIRPRDLLTIETKLNIPFSSAISFQPDFIQLTAVIGPSREKKKIVCEILIVIPQKFGENFIDRENPHTAESFARILREWKSGELNPERNQTDML